jgi:hypothetical protein
VGGGVGKDVGVVETRFEVLGQWETHRGSPFMEAQLSGNGASLGVRGPHAWIFDGVLTVSVPS